VGIYEDGTTFIHEDNWRSPKSKAFRPKMRWRGTTTFKTKTASQDKQHYTTNPKVPRQNRIEGSNSPHRRNLAPLLHRLVKSKLYSRQRHSGRKTVIELCCGNDSRLGCEGFVGRNAKVVRITEQDDFTSQNGLQKTMDAIRDPSAGFLTAWVSMPCTWGSSARNFGIDTCDYAAWSVAHWDLFERLFPNVVAVIHEILSMGGDLVLEWPTNNYLWNLPAMQQFCSQYGLIPVDLSGCMVGLTARKGIPLKKPWTLMTTNPYLVDVFR